MYDFSSTGLTANWHQSLLVGWLLMAWPVFNVPVREWLSCDLFPLSPVLAPAKWQAIFLREMESEHEKIVVQYRALIKAVLQGCPLTGPPCKSPF